MSRQPADDLLYIESIFRRDGIWPLRGTAWNDSDLALVNDVRYRVLEMHKALIRLVDATQNVVCQDGSELMLARDAAISALKGKA